MKTIYLTSLLLLSGCGGAQVLISEQEKLAIKREWFYMRDDLEELNKKMNKCLQRDEDHGEEN